MVYFENATGSRGLAIAMRATHYASRGSPRLASCNNLILSPSYLWNSPNDIWNLYASLSIYIYTFIHITYPSVCVHMG